MNNNLIGYRCVACGTSQPAEPPPLLCPACGGALDAEYDYDRIAAQLTPAVLTGDPERSLWRYRALLPVDGTPANRSLQVGGTPLVALPLLAGKFDLGALYIKDETRQPSGSLKDRATEVALQHSAEYGQATVVAASTGNAAASLATLAAHHGRRAVILVPAGTAAGKLVPIMQCGAMLCPVDGTYDDAFELVETIARELGWYSRNSGSNPVLSEGKKTVALEIAEQLQWAAPDKVFVPVGDGCIIGGVYKGFYDLLQLGWTNKLPQLVAVQAAGSAAVVRALESGGEIEAVQADTIADGIRVNLPRDGQKALRAVRATDGFGITVTDDEILEAQHSLAKGTGIFAEPSAAAAYAGFKKALSQRLISPGESVVLLIPGSGLKDLPAAGRLVEQPEPVAANLGAFREFYERFTAGESA